MKKLFATLLVCGVMVATVVAAGCTVRVNMSADDSSETTIIDDMSNYNNPDAVSTFQDYATLEEACDAVTTDISAPESIGGSTSRQYQAAPNSGMLQVAYLDDSGNQVALLRKSPAILGQDISSDPTGYSQTVSATVGEYVVDLRGDDNLVRVASWSTATYSYSISADPGLPSDEMEAIIATIQ